MAETEAPPAADIEERSGEHSSSVPRRVKVLVGVVLAVMFVLIVYGYSDMPWSGWIGVANKRFWDYLDLLFVPAALALGVYWLNRRQDERDQQAEEDRSRRESEAQAAQVERALEVENERAQDAAVQAYLDQLTQLLVTQGDDALIKMQVDEDVRQVIQARSEPLLRSLSATRRWGLVLFLAVMGLLAKARPLVSLAGADLRGVDGREAPLAGINLRGADLMEADLSNANLLQTNLSNANLREADLSNANLSKAFVMGANLSGANLTRADLSNANLIEAFLMQANLNKTNFRGVYLSKAFLPSANLKEADLSGANLSGANLTWARGVTVGQLIEARSLKGATMPDGQEYEDWIKDREGRKENGKNSGSP